MFELSNFIVCDYVRQETEGKYTCIGVYPNATISVTNFVVPIRISLYIEIRSKTYETIDVHFVLEDRQANKIFSSFPARVKLFGWASPPLATFPLEIGPTGPCTVHFSAISSDQKIEVGSITIFEAQPSALPTPS